MTDQVTEDTATISWDRVQAVIDRYVVNYTSVDGDTEEMEVGKNETTTTLTGLKPGIEYVIFLWAEKGTQHSKRISTEAVTGIAASTQCCVVEVISLSVLCSSGLLQSVYWTRVYLVVTYDVGASMLQAPSSFR